MKARHDTYNGTRKSFSSSGGGERKKTPTSAAKRSVAAATAEWKKNLEKHLLGGGKCAFGRNLLRTSSVVNKNRGEDIVGAVVHLLCISLARRIPSPSLSFLSSYGMNHFHPFKDGGHFVSPQAKEHKTFFKVQYATFELLVGWCLIR